jgi:hypothetical protein
VILALDPGTEQTGWALVEDLRVLDSGVAFNEQILDMLESGIGLRAFPHRIAIEMIASYGMPVGREVFETCVWIGRFVQAWEMPHLVRLIYRKDVKMHLCGTPRAKDANVWQALLDKLGPVGTKKAPGPLYGVKSHARAALAVAVTAAEIGVEQVTEALR